MFVYIILTDKMKTEGNNQCKVIQYYFGIWSAFVTLMYTDCAYIRIYDFCNHIMGVTSV